MRKILFEIPALGIKLPSFGVSMLLACCAALFLTSWRARRERLDPESVFELAVWLMSGGFIGARLLYIIAHPESVRGLADVFKLWQGGIVFYGCIIGGLIGSLIYWFKHPFPFRPMADAVAPSLALGSAIGRLGCFLNGCCFGGVTDLPWGVSFPSGSHPWARHVENGMVAFADTHSLPIHPTQLYAAARRLPDPRPAHGLFPVPPSRRRGDGPADGDLFRQPLPHRRAPRRRAGHVARLDDVAVDQRRDLRRRGCRACVSADAAARAICRRRGDLGSRPGTRRHEGGPGAAV